MAHWGIIGSLGVVGRHYCKGRWETFINGMGLIGGRCGSLRVVVDGRHLGVIGGHWGSLRRSPPDRMSTILDIFGHFWTFLDIFGHFWTFLDIYRHLSTFLDIFGHFWTFLDIFRNFWFLDIFGHF